METEVAEVAPDVFRLSTFIPDANFMFNQFLLLDEEPLLFHTGPRGSVPAGHRCCVAADGCGTASMDHLRPRRGR